jgi:hypothetical protein
MSKRLPAPLSAAEQELELLEHADELFEKSAASVAEETDYVRVEESRFEDRPPVAPDDEDEDENEKEERRRSSSSMIWGAKPTLRNQLQEQPRTVRFVDPETKMLDLSKAADLKEYNRIQRAAADLESPTLAVQEIDKQKHEGTWVVLITFCTVQYMQL